MYRACIFDLDGTLVNTLNSIAHYSNAALKECGYPSIQTEEYRKIVGDGADMQVCRMLGRVCEGGAFTETQAAELKKIYMELYEKNPVLLVTEYSGMRETLSKLKQAGIKTAVLSNKPHNWTVSIISALFPKGTFYLCYGQCPEIPRKPSPEGALRIARELGIGPEDCLYVGDTNTDMKTGAAAGMDTAGVLWGFRGRRELEENRAKYIVETPEEVYRLAAGTVR